MIHDAPLLLLVLLVLVLLKLMLLIRLVALLLLLMVMGEMLLLLMVMGEVLLLMMMMRHVLLLLLLVEHILLLLVLLLMMKVLVSLLRPHFMLLRFAKKLSLDFFKRPNSAGLNRRRWLLAWWWHLVPHGLLTEKLLLLLLKKQEMLGRQLTHGHDRRIIEAGRCRKLRHGKLRRHWRHPGRKAGRHRRKSHHVHDGRIGGRRLVHRVGRRRATELQLVAHFVCQSRQRRLPKWRLPPAILSRQI